MPPTKSSSKASSASSPPKDAKAANAVDYKGGKVFFCCMNCPKAFAADTAKFAAKANHQLVATGQAKQAKCPFTGEDVDTATKITVERRRGLLLLRHVQGKADGVEGTDRADLQRQGLREGRLQGRRRRNSDQPIEFVRVGDANRLPLRRSWREYLAAASQIALAGRTGSAILRRAQSAQLVQSCREHFREEVAMKMFFSVGEPSGDLHGANLIRRAAAAATSAVDRARRLWRAADAGRWLRAAARHERAGRDGSVSGPGEAAGVLAAASGRPSGTSTSSGPTRSC